MHVIAETQFLHKNGNSPHEYEDAFFPRSSVDIDAWYFRAAVADGATETSFAGSWAKELAEGYCKRRINEVRIAATIPRIQRRWQSGVSRVDLPWYAEEKLRQGAFSSLLGINIVDSDTEGRQWSVLAAGDTCLFHIRDCALLCAFPLEDPEEFNSRPHLLSSLPSYNPEVDSSLLRASGWWATGDRFLLMTDAIALWFLTLIRAGEQPWYCLADAISSPVAFERLVSCLRERAALRNDDVTVMSIEVE